MSDLHYALLIVAGVLLAALFAYNTWQERRMLKRLDRALRGSVGDPLMDAAGSARSATSAPVVGAAASPPVAAQTAAAKDTPAVEVTDLPLAALYGGRVEPRFDLPGAERQPAGSDVGPQAAPDLAPFADDGVGSMPDAGAPADIVPRWVEDPMIDWVLELRCAHAVDGVSVFDAAAPLARLDSMLPAFLVAWDARSQQWVEPDRFGFYSELLVATQLAHRKHRLDEISASRFIAAVQQVAMALDADFDAPDVKRVVQMADELDQTLARFDVQIGITLQGALPWSAERIDDAAARAALVPAGRLRWERLSPAGQRVFTLSAAGDGATDRLALELDVPLAPMTADPVRAMFAAADTLAMELGARLIDDNGRPVNAASLPAIAEQLDALYVQMREAGIEPGGLRARRLYAQAA